MTRAPETDVDAFADACNALYSAMRTNRARLDAQAAAASALSDSQAQLVTPLARLGAMTIGELAQEARLAQPTVTRSVKALESAGLVQRTSHPHDDRRVVVALTDRGRAHWDRARTRLRDNQRAAWDLLPAELQPRVVELLGALTEAVTATKPAD
ncbi:MarR family transcriptional regulator [Amycolatopsis rhabdoformis]|uniref:MarR family transcriptional regulator n=1 Tax=Amycolatopsis rhabdoformis TaxID=1448059 RepID=A0ABZ1IJ72_9PSEU|nr:MarR family transcriptional regulator [Amycolatopsis rhabdoformis]WSE34441.1 MarR family transcriptional regulator [Amycolatopsis rhabdoformis]